MSALMIITLICLVMIIIGYLAAEYCRNQPAPSDAYIIPIAVSIGILFLGVVGILGVLFYWLIS